MVLTGNTILLVRQLAASFIDTDLEILRRHFGVIDHHYRSFPHPARHLIAWMFRHRKEYDAVFIWFGDVHATVATAVAFALGKPCILVAGGYDVSEMPGHGFLATRLGRLFARIHFGLARRIIAVSVSVQSRLVAFRPRLAPKIQILPPGCDVDFWTPGSSTRETIVTAALAGDWHRAHVKGLDRVVEFARQTPGRQFEIIGLDPSIWPLFGPVPSNLVLVGPVGREELRERYRRALVYLQLSRDEALGMVIAEAMACECIPVVARAGGMPEVVGDAGLVVDGEDLRAVEPAIVEAVSRPELRARARTRIREGFNVPLRERGLLAMFRSVLP